MSFDVIDSSAPKVTGTCSVRCLVVSYRPILSVLCVIVIKDILKTMSFVLSDYYNYYMRAITYTLVVINRIYHIIIHLK